MQHGPAGLEQFVDMPAAYHAGFVAAFRRPEQVRWSQIYLKSLLGPEAHKTSERIALI